jgi:hypothetical protein
MNANKLFKLLNEAEDSFNNLGLYKKILSQSAHINFDFSNFKSFDILGDKAMDTAKAKGLSLPFDNVLFDIDGVDAPDLSGEIKKQSLLLHIIPVEISTDISTFKVMLIQDMRSMDRDIYPRSHIVSLDSTNIMSVSAVDEGMASLGCKCSSKSPFSYGKIFKQLQSFTPGFKADCGFISPKCESNLACCQYLQSNSKAISKIAIATIIYMNMPEHETIKVTNAAGQDGLRNMPQHLICDKTTWDGLHIGGTSGGSNFKDGNDFDKFYSAEQFTLTAADKFTRGSLQFEPVIE